MSDLFDKLRQSMAATASAARGAELAAEAQAKAIAAHAERITAVERRLESIGESLLLINAALEELRGMDGSSLEDLPLPPAPPTEPETDLDPDFEHLPLRAVPIKSIAASHTDHGSVDHINNGSDQYPSGWFARGAAWLDVELAETAAVESVHVLMHAPDDRICDLDVAGQELLPDDSTTEDAEWYQAEGLAAGPGFFRINLSGNSVNDWNGVYAVEVYTHDPAPVVEPVDVDIPAPSGWPKRLEGGAFTTTYNGAQGAELFAQGLDAAGHFRHHYTHDGRSVRASTQAEFDAARDNPDIGVIRWNPSTVTGLQDRRRAHGLAQLLICDTLSSIRTDGGLVIEAARLARPQGQGHNVVALGSHVLLSLPAGAQLPISWDAVTFMNRPHETVENVVMQGGILLGNYAPGAERVLFGGHSWIRDLLPDEYRANGGKPWDLHSRYCGVQGIAALDLGADMIQTVLHYDKKGSYAGAPHGEILHEGIFARGCILGVTPPKQGRGHVEQLMDLKTRSNGTAVMADCLVHGVMQNHVGANSAHGDAIGTHFESDGVTVERCLIDCQRGAEFGSGAHNSVIDSLFCDPKPWNNRAIEMGLVPSGAFSIVAYRDGAEKGIQATQTEVSAMHNTYIGGANHSGIVTDMRGFEVFGSGDLMRVEMNALGMVPYGTGSTQANDLWRL